MSGTLAILVLAFAALVAWAYFRRRDETGGLPQGHVTYQDTDGRRIRKTLVSHRYGLAGRPDYVVQTPDGIVPIEVKSRLCGPERPFPGEEAQLFAYCLLVEDVMGVQVRSGILQFANRQWTLNFGDGERRMLLAILDEMRSVQSPAEVNRSHDQAGKCCRCGFRAPHVCGQAITDHDDDRSGRR